MTHHQSDMTATGFAFLAGAAVGIAAGLLFAPRGGEETRAQLKEKVRQARTKAEEAMDARKDEAREKLTEFTDTAREAAEEGQAKVGRARRTAVEPEE